jgi:hypothetical protein
LRLSLEQARLVGEHDCLDAVALLHDEGGRTPASEKCPVGLPCEMNRP